MRDLKQADTLDAIRSFARQLREMRDQFRQSEKLHYVRQKQSYFVDAVEIYCAAVAQLNNDLDATDVRSQGLIAFRDYLHRYTASRPFQQLRGDTTALKQALAEIKYDVNIRGNRVRVTRYDGETDYSTEVLQTFEKFAQGAVEDYRVKLSNSADMDHVEAQVLECIAQLWPDTFTELANYHQRHSNYLDAVIGRFDREIQVYVSYLEFARKIAETGLNFCFPDVSAESKQIQAEDTFDIGLAARLALEGQPVVRNSLYLADPERIFVVTGPNQGGKTTFARTVGQLHYLAGLGLPVPGTDARLFLFDQLFTHFEKEENLQDLRGKLEDDLVRLHDILARATSRSVVIMNEIFTSTTVADALFLGTKTIEQLTELDALCVYVTFIDELASLGKATVSMVSSVEPDNPAVRTFKVVRRAADGRAYAITIAEKYGLTRERLAGRLVS
jgi:DNA mismatch repair ATPase MutS